MCGWVALRAFLWVVVAMVALCAQLVDLDAQTPGPDVQPSFELTGRIQPAQPLPVYLQGATAPFEAITEADLDGRFHFRKLPTGAYVVMVGALQRTVEVGPSLADSKGRVNVTIDLRNAEVEKNFDRKDRVSVGELSIPREAWHEYEESQKALGKRDVTAAVAHLKRALDLAPRFSAAWNHLGTIAYQSGQYFEAETDFRKGLEADPDAYAPLVNLGGVLINLAKWDQALEYNRQAVLKSPHDALANSQLGMAYFYADQLGPAEKYLAAAKQIDPAHFSHPQVLLAEIHVRRNEPEAAAAELDDLLRRHPDLPDASKIKAQIAQLRAGN
jgi:tetratricopeptide (TPR) repeat protein